MYLDNCMHIHIIGFVGEELIKEDLWITTFALTSPCASQVA
jgi:hypothetical protein